MPTRGQAHDWTDDDIESVTALSLRDIENARAYWTSNVPRPYRLALSGAGSERDIERGLEALIAHGESVVGDLTEQVRGGRLSVEDWQTAMAGEIVTQSLCALAAGLGGWANVTMADLARLRDGDVSE